VLVKVNGIKIRRRAWEDNSWQIVDSLDFYKGIDIVKPLIAENNKKYNSTKVKFEVCNLLKKFPYNGEQFDAVLIKDAFVHFPEDEIFKALEIIKRSGIKYLIMTNFTAIDENHKIEIFGQWRPLNFLLKPFNFPNFLSTINEKNESHKWNDNVYRDKNLSIWELKNIKEEDDNK
jgi:hypothetical protein